MKGIFPYKQHANSTPKSWRALAQSPAASPGAEGWTSIYFTIEKGKRGDPLPPPYNLNAPDPFSLRPPEEQQAIWDAYEEMVAYAAQNLTVVTSEGIVMMAQN